MFVTINYDAVKAALVILAVGFGSQYLAEMICSTDTRFKCADSIDRLSDAVDALTARVEVLERDALDAAQGRAP